MIFEECNDVYPYSNVAMLVTQHFVTQWTPNSFLVTYPTCVTHHSSLYWRKLITDSGFYCFEQTQSFQSTALSFT